MGAREKERSVGCSVTSMVCYKQLKVQRDSVNMVPRPVPESQGTWEVQPPTLSVVSRWMFPKLAHLACPSRPDLPGRNPWGVRVPLSVCLMRWLTFITNLTHLESPEESPAERLFILRDYLHWTGLWVCLWKEGAVVIKLRLSPLWVSSFPGQGVLIHLRVEKPS